MALDLDFGWSVDEKGYRLDHGRIVGNGGPKHARRLQKFPTLYQQFAKIQQTPEGLLDFVNKFGRLTLDAEGDNVRAVLQHASMISMALEMERRLRGQGGRPSKWRGGRFEYDVPQLGLKVQGGIPLGRSKLSAWLVPNPATGAW